MMFVRKAKYDALEAQHEETLRELAEVRAVMEDERASARKANGERIIAQGKHLNAAADRDAALIALRNIVEAETPGCAHVGKRMARIAREALPEYAAADREIA